MMTDLESEIDDYRIRNNFDGEDESLLVQSHAEIYFRTLLATNYGKQIAYKVADNLTKKLYG